MTEERLLQTAKPIEIPAPHFGITLRQFSLSDAPHIFILINKNRKHLSRFGDTTSKKYPTLASVENSITNPSNPDRLRFGIWNNKHKFVGSINLTPDEDNAKKGEVGYYLGREFTGRGYMLNATLTLATYAFYHRGIDELYAKVDLQNDASAKVLEKAGFRETGKTMEDGRETIIFTLRKP